MGLLTAAPIWANYVDNMPSTPSNNVGTQVTAGANNADGTAVSALSALAFDVELLQIGVQGFAAAAGNGSTLLDIMIDPAGGTSWAPLIDDLLAGMTAAANLGSAITAPHWYMFPLWVPAGASVGLQARTAHSATLSGRVILRAWGGNRNPGSWWCGQKVTSLGIDDANSKGTDHTPGNTGALSSWADLGAVLPIDAGAAQWAFQGDDDGDQQTRMYRLEFGAGATMIGGPLHGGTGTGETGVSFPRAPGFCNIPAGTQLQVRGTCNSTADTIDVAAYLTS